MKTYTLTSKAEPLSKNEKAYQVYRLNIRASNAREAKQEFKTITKKTGYII